MSLHKMFFAVALLLGISCASTALAQFPCQTGIGGGWGNPYSYYVGSDRPPFFAIYPPVYYSYPVPRTYGYSPFAYPAGTMTPELSLIEPMTISNPHVEPAPTPAKPEALPKPATKSSSFSQTAEQRVLVIDNPYFDQPLSPIVPVGKSY